MITKKIQQAVLNIVNNAIQAIGADNSITLKTRIASNKTINGQRIRLAAQISIIDNGPGIPNKIQDTLFLSYGFWSFQRDWAWFINRTNIGESTSW